MKRNLIFIPWFFLSTAKAALPDYSQYAPPPIPSALSEKIQSYLDIRAPGAGILSPDGKQVFFSWGVTGTPQIWRLLGPKSFPVQLTGGELTTKPEAITRHGEWLVLSRDRSGEENPGLYLVSPKGGALRLIQHKPKVQTRFAFVSRDSKWVYFTANELSPSSYAVYRYSIEEEKTELLFSDPGIWSIADYKDDGTLLLSKHIGSFQNEIYEWSPGTRKLSALLGKDEKLPFDAMYGARPGELLVSTYKFGEFFRLYSWKNGDWKEIGARKNWDVNSFDIDRSKKRIVYTINENGFSKTYAMDARSFKPISMPQFPGALQVYFGMFDSAGANIMLNIVTDGAPRVSYSYNFAKQRLTQWVLPSTPEVDTSRFATTSLESYPARDGTRIPMLVNRPEKCRTELCPVIVDFHGGPESQHIPNFSLGDQLFVEEGFVLVRPNVRGSSGYGKSWLNADNGPKRLSVITDIEDCGKYIRETWKKNGVPPKIGVKGGSYGGYSVNIAMTLFAGTYDAGSSEVGMSNLVTFINNTAPYRRALRITEYGDPAKDKDVMEKLSPIFHVDKIKAPLQLIQGANDPRVPLTEAVQMLEKMKEKNIPGKLIVFPDEGHGTQKRGNRAAALGAELLFFRETLLPH